jgi:hypothetical protein
MGEVPPGGILWTFMGASFTYTLFTGIAEVLGAMLLLTRRTTLLGALLCSAVLSNIVMLNFCYGVPVKLFASHLLVMAVFLILPDLRRLANLLLLNRRAEPIDYPPLFARKWLNLIALLLPAVLVVAHAARVLHTDLEIRKTYGDLAPRPPLYGIWNVEEFEVAGEVRPPLLSDPIRWRRLVVDSPGSISIQHMSDAWMGYLVQVDADTRTLALTKPQDSTWQSAVSYKEREPGLLALEGTFDGRKIRANLRRDESEFPLVNGKFRWVIE